MKFFNYERDKKVFQDPSCYSGSDLSMKAVDYAISETRKNDATLTALYVIRIPTGSYDLVVFPYDELIKKDTEDAQKWFDTIRKKAQENNVSLKTEILDYTRSTAQVIVEYAEKEKMDLIVVGTMGKTGFKKMLLGSVALVWSHILHVLS